MEALHVHNDLHQIAYDFVIFPGALQGYLHDRAMTLQIVPFLSSFRLSDFVKYRHQVTGSMAVSYCILR